MVYADGLRSAIVPSKAPQHKHRAVPATEYPFSNVNSPLRPFNSTEERISREKGEEREQKKKKRIYGADREDGKGETIQDKQDEIDKLLLPTSQVDRWRNNRSHAPVATKRILALSILKSSDTKSSCGRVTA